MKTSNHLWLLFLTITFKLYYTFPPIKHISGKHRISKGFMLNANLFCLCVLYSFLEGQNKN